jgi:hypothetical protein
METDTNTRDRRVVAATWQWRDGAGRAAGGSGWGRKAAGCGIPLLVAALLMWRGRWRPAWIVAGIGCSYLAALLFAPGVAQRIDAGLRRFGMWVGIGLTWLLLVPVFYVVFAGSAVLLKLASRQPLGLKLDPSRQSYWRVPESRRRNDGASYSHQF